MTHQNNNSLTEYLKTYRLKFISDDAELCYPLSWSCLFYHQMGADFEFDALEDVESETERIEILFQEWSDGKLISNKCEYDSDDSKQQQSNSDDDALLTQVPDFIFNF